MKYVICRAGVRHPHVNHGAISFFVPKHSWENKVCELKPGGRVVIETGVKMDVPEGQVLLISNTAVNPAVYGLVVDTKIVTHGDSSEIILSLHSTNLEHSIFITEDDEIATGVVGLMENVTLVENELVKVEDKS